MREKIINEFEQKVEHIPTLEEVSEVLKQMVKGDHQETKRSIDGQGNLYLLYTTVQGAEDGDYVELFYRRKVYVDGNKATEININSAYFKNGSFDYTGPQAELIDGKWVLMD